MYNQPTLPNVVARGRERKPCLSCGRMFTPTATSAVYGPVCALRLKSARLAQLLASRPTTTKPKRLTMSKTKPYARIAGNKCDRHPRCDNQATLAVGERGQWRLCDHCAIRGEFEQFSKRVPLKAVI